MQRIKNQPKSGTRAYAKKYASKNRKKLNEQAKDRMRRFRKRQRIAWGIVTSEKELARLTPRARKAIKAALNV